MTVRAVTAASSPGPEHRVLYIEELRAFLGMGPDALTTLPPADSASTDQRLKVFLVGHDMHDDFENMEKQGIKLPSNLIYSGCIDTHAMIEDTGNGMSTSLSAAMARYNFAKLHMSRPMKGKGKWVIDGAHNAGNDAISTIMVTLAQALDIRMNTTYTQTSNVDGDSGDDWLSRPLESIDKNIILLAYDTEKVENRYKPNILHRTTEHGFAWVRFADIANIAPGHSYGIDWHKNIQAAHFINKEWRDFSNTRFVCGNVNGFWPQYGRSQYYDPKHGAAPFRKLFEQLARRPNIDGVTAAFANASLKTKDPAAALSSQKPAKSSDGTVRGDSSGRGRTQITGNDTGSQSPQTRGSAWKRGSTAAKGGLRPANTASATVKVPTTTEKTSHQDHFRLHGVQARVMAGGTESSSSDEDSTTGSIITPASTPPSRNSPVPASAPVKKSWAQIARGG